MSADRPGADRPRLSADDVVHVARLARLELSDEEVALFTSQLASILDHAADLDALDLDGVAPTAHPIPLANVLRPDVVVAGVDRADALAGAPASEDDRFKVPRIVGEAP